MPERALWLRLLRGANKKLQRNQQLVSASGREGERRPPLARRPIRTHTRASKRAHPHTRARFKNQTRALLKRACLKIKHAARLSRAGLARPMLPHRFVPFPVPLP